MKGEFIPAKRWLVEDGNEILEKSKEKKVGAAIIWGSIYCNNTY